MAKITVPGGTRAAGGLSFDYGNNLLLRNCNLVDVINGKIKERCDVRIAKGKILSIDNTDGKSNNDIVIDLNNRYLIPGLIDGHCHTTISPVFAMSNFDLIRHVKQIERQFTICIESGVTTVRDTGSFSKALHGYISDIEKGNLSGPRVYYCNSMLNIMGGHPDVPPTDINPLADLVALFIGTVPLNFKGMKDLKGKLVENTRHASFIKTTVDNKSVFCRKEDIPVYSDDHLAEIFAHAEKLNLPVASHCHRKWGFDRITRYPVHNLEHMVSDGYLSDADIKMMSKKNISIVPTMTIGATYLMEEAFDEIPEKYRNDFIVNEIKIRRDYLHGIAYKHCDAILHKKNMAMLKYYKQLGWDNLWKNKIFIVDPDLYFGMIKYGTVNLRKMKEEGVLIGCGIDAGMPLSYFGGLYREMELYARIGFKNDEILKCVTINNAKILGLDDRLGSIEAGKIADLVVLDDNPLTKVEAYRRPTLVIKDGKIVHGKEQLEMNAMEIAIQQQSERRLCS